MLNELKLRNLMERFFIEDIRDQDITTEAIFPNQQIVQITFSAKESGIFCGEAVIKIGYQLLDSQIDVKLLCKDGDEIHQQQPLAVVTGQVQSLLKGERVILNLIQRMSGIATLTQKAVNTLHDEHTKLCDTRKTAPGLRMFEKYAVRCGGGYNHRFGLYDGVMIKDNHIAFAGSITRAVQLAKATIGHMMKIEVEAETHDQVVEAVEAGADIIMLDNRTPDEIKHLSTLIPKHIITEASGGITLDNLATFQQTGVDYISLGFLTHSYTSLDISVNVSLNSSEEENHPGNIQLKGVSQ